MVKKRGEKKQTIVPSNIFLNKRNILFLLITLLVIILIIYFAIKAWPIIQERLGDEDNDGIKNYKDKCPDTMTSVNIDEYGCEIEISGQKEHPELIKVLGGLDFEEIVCSEDDGGNNIWKKGNCKDKTGEKKDYCKENFGPKLFEYECFGVICIRNSVDCEDYSALCYDGRCIEKDDDTDKDGYPDLSELGNGTDPNNPNDYPGHIITQGNQSDCNSRCISLGYISGRGPFSSIGYCNSPEVGQYVSGNSGEVCCCMPASTGYYSFQQCLSLQNSHGADFSQKQETDWAQSSCQAYASPRCNATNIGFDRNCCWWSCYVEAQLTYEQMCQQWMIVTGGSYWILGLSSSQACYDKAVQDCANKGQQYSLSMYQNPTTGCCSWKCKEVQVPCVDYDVSYGSNAFKQPSYCIDVNGEKKDNCESGNIVREQFCQNNVCMDSRLTCPAGTSCETDSSGRGYCKDNPPAPVCYNSNYEAGYRGIEILQHKGYCTDDSGITKHWHKCIDAPQVLEWWVCGEKCEKYSYACRELIPYTYCSAYGIDWCERIPGTENIDPPECQNVCSGYPRSIFGSSGCPEILPICSKLGSTLSSYTKKGGTNCCCFKCDEID